MALYNQLEKYKDDAQMLILFTETFDVIFNADKNKLLETFYQFQDARILFSADKTCPPDVALSLASK